MALEKKTKEDGSKITPEVKNVESNVDLDLLKKQQKEIEELKELVGKIASQNSTGPAPDKTADIIAAVVGELKKKSDAEKYGERGGKYVDEEDQDPDDILEKGVPFFSHSGGYVIVDDKKNGRPVATPFREPIIFNHYQTKVTGSGKDLKTEVTSRYISNSKKEVEWLRNSSYYGWKIFDDFKAAQSSHAKLASHINRFLTAARTMQREQLFSACKAMDIKMSTDIESMRLQYAQILAEKALKDEERNALESLKGQKLEEAMLEDQKTIF